MKPLETKIIKIAGKDFPVKKSPRAYLKFEEISGHSISEFDGTTKDSLYFLYSCLWGGSYRGSWEDFLELTDDESPMDLINSFVKLMSEPAPTEKKQKVR